MKEFNVNTDMFGRYAKIPTGFNHELHTYKIVCLKESNAYCDIPLGTSSTKQTWHDKSVPILQVIHCGVDETKVERVALKDCEIVGDTPQTVKHGRWEYDENAVDFNIGGWCCSECGVRNNNLPNDRLNPYLFSGSSYCPQCGAKMDGTEETEIND